jgi:hypothetical protein
MSADVISLPLSSSHSISCLLDRTELDTKIDESPRGGLSETDLGTLFSCRTSDQNRSEHDRARLEWHRDSRQSEALQNRVGTADARRAFSGSEVGTLRRSSPKVSGAQHRINRLNSR